jgi:uncharacterized protein (DUF1800 family)
LPVATRWPRLGSATVLSLLLAACGSGNSTDEAAAEPPTQEASARFLTQASFGPDEASAERVVALGYNGWIDEQMARPQGSHRAAWDAAEANIKLTNPSGTIGQDGVINSFWKQALAGDDQLRQRVAYALSQIFVISMQDNNLGENPRSAASFLDMLGSHAFGNYRDLLEAVALHPAMGQYLSHLRNQKADARTGRVPDENFAREVMQLFSIGLVQLELDGSPTFVGGKTVDTYTQADIAGLAKVFTGWSWACPDAPDNGCFFSGSANGNSDPDRRTKPMVAYAQYHSKEEKRFLGTTIQAQTTADPKASLKVALDTLFNHPNVGPFIGKQLIQRLVTSNPGPDYVRAVASAFNDNGAGVRGDLKAVIKAVLLHPEARTLADDAVNAKGAGKLREPVLRLSAMLRAFHASSDTGQYRVGNTDNPASQLGQTPLRAPSVFNFYRPGYVAPGTAAAAAGLASPEMQLTQETAAAGYVNYMRDNISQGVGASNTTVGGVALNRRDVRLDYSAELALAEAPAELVERMNAKLMYGTMPAALKAEIEAAVAKIVLPKLTANGSNQAQLDAARRNRVQAAALLTVVSPEYQVQK